jgi:hypothetical protein
MDKKQLALKLIYLLLGSILLIPLLSACSKTTTATTTAVFLDSQFTLAPGQPVRMASEAMDIKFIGVSQDSRCPTGVQCIRAGDVSAEIEITIAGKVNQITLKDDPAAGAAQGYVFQGYMIAFSVAPYPEANKTIAKEDYRLSLEFSKLVK